MKTITPEVIPPSGGRAPKPDPGPWTRGLRGVTGVLTAAAVIVAAFFGLAFAFVLAIVLGLFFWIASLMPGAKRRPAGWNIQSWAFRARPGGGASGAGETRVTIKEFHVGGRPGRGDGPPEPRP